MTLVLSTQQLNIFLTKKVCVRARALHTSLRPQLVKMDLAIEKLLAESKLVKRPNKKNLINWISVYLNSRKGVMGAEVLQLLQNLDTYLRMVKLPNATKSNIKKLSS